jgi:predicted signal transduction protein with EAL and GGDEF domain
MRHVGASIGFVELPRDANSPEVMFVRADEAICAAKRAGGGRMYRASEAGAVEVI